MLLYMLLSTITIKIREYILFYYSISKDNFTMNQHLWLMKKIYLSVSVFYISPFTQKTAFYQ
jgi:hypothetical protein